MLRNNIEMLCSECGEFTDHELYDYREGAEMWECTECENVEILSR